MLELKNQGRSICIKFIISINFADSCSLGLRFNLV